MLTPQDVRAAQFEKNIRGYRTEEVDRFLDKVEEQLKQDEDQAEELRRQIAELTAENQRLHKEMESYEADGDMLKSALINAQRMGENVIREANQKSEEILHRANLRGDDIIRDANELLQKASDRADEIINEANEKKLAEEREYDRVRLEVTRFKSDVLNLYRSHVESLSRLPEFQKEEAPAEEPEESAAEDEVEETTAELNEKLDNAADAKAPETAEADDAAEDGDAADDLHRAGHGAQKDEPEQHRPGGVRDVQRHAAGGADDRDALVVEQVRARAGERRQGHYRCARIRDGVPREGPGAEDGQHYDEVHEGRRGFADLQGGLVVHGVVAHAPGAQHRLAAPSDDAHDRADQAKRRVSDRRISRSGVPHHHDARERAGKRNELARPHALFQQDKRHERTECRVKRRDDRGVACANVVNGDQVARHAQRSAEKRAEHNHLAASGL